MKNLDLCIKFPDNNTLVIKSSNCQFLEDCSDLIISYFEELDSNFYDND